MPGRFLQIANAQLRFRNFAGKAGKYNPEGMKNFCILLDKDQADGLAADGWNVKWLKPRDEDEPPQAYMSVKVSYENIPPKIELITKKNKTELKESEINVLDWAEIELADVTITPYHWKVNGKAGIKAYLKDLYITIVEDEFAEKYRDVPDSGIIGGDND